MPIHAEYVPFKMMDFMLCELYLNKNEKTKKWTKDLNVHVTEKYVHMASKHLKTYSISLVIREVQI